MRLTITSASIMLMVSIMTKSTDIATYLKRNIDLLPTLCVFMLAEELADAVLEEAHSVEPVGYLVSWPSGVVEFCKSVIMTHLPDRRRQSAAQKLLNDLAISSYIIP